MRDAFLKALNNRVMENSTWLNAEEVTKKFDFFDTYDDVLLFETELAQIVKLIVLFCDGVGSAAELGAFAAIDEILERLFVVVREHHYIADSFIKLGPLRRIEKKIGRGAIAVISDKDVGMSEKDVSKIDKDVFVSLLQSPLHTRLNTNREPTTFNPEKSGHIIKLIVGLVQEYGALTADEILTLLKTLNVNRSIKEISGYILCCKAVEWLDVRSRGANDYLVSKVMKVDAATLSMKAEAKEKVKSRRRMLILEQWKKIDPQRLLAIKSVRREA